MDPDKPLDSVVVTKTIRLIAPFILTFGLFTMFHGANTIGGGFQGGVIVASVIVLIAFGFGIEQTGQWLNQRLLLVVAVVGIAVFTSIGLSPILFGGTFLELTVLPISKGALYAIEGIEFGIGMTVAAVIIILFFEISEGIASEDR